MSTSSETPDEDDETNDADEADALEIPGMDLLDVVVACLREDGRAFETQDDEVPTLRLRHDGAAGGWSYYLRIEPDPRAVIVYSVFPIDAPVDRRAAVMECVCRINSGLVFGNLEIDLDDGEILGKTSISARGAALTVALVRNLIEDNLEMMEVYIPALVDVLEGRLAPAAAVERAEGDAG